MTYFIIQVPDNVTSADIQNALISAEIPAIISKGFTDAEIEEIMKKAQAE